MPLPPEGPYARLYESSELLWGDHIGSMVEYFWDRWCGARKPHGFETVLDLGAGEGGNAIYLAERGFHVDLVEVSGKALRNYERRLRSVSPETASRLHHTQGLAGEVAVAGPYDVVIAYGLLHCFPARGTAERMADYVMTQVRPGGMLIVSSLTDGVASDAAHPELSSCYFPTPEQLDRWFSAFDIIDRQVEQFTEQHADGPEHRHEVYRALLRRHESER